MTIELPPELEAIVRREFATGEYESEADVLLRAAKLLEKLRLHRLRSAVRVGLDELDRGEGIVLNGTGELKAFFDDIVNRGMERLHSKRDGA